MPGFASKIITALFRRASARPPTPRRRAASGFETLETRAVLSTAVPTTTVDDVIVDGPIITGENFDSARAGGGGAGAGKVSMQDFHFGVLHNSAASRHRGGINVALADGSVRGISQSIDSRPAWSAAASSHSTRAGAGKVSMQDFHFAVLHNSAASRHPSEIVTGIDYRPNVLYNNIWINQNDLDSVIDDLATDVAGHYASRGLT